MVATPAAQLEAKVAPVQLSEPPPAQLTAEAQPARRGPSELTKSWANHFSNPQYSPTPGPLAGNPETVAAVKAAKAGQVTDTSLDKL